MVPVSSATGGRSRAEGTTSGAVVPLPTPTVAGVTRRSAAAFADALPGSGAGVCRSPQRQQQCVAVA